MDITILGIDIIEMFFLVLILGFANGRLTRLLMNEASFLYTGIIFRYIFGQRYTRMVAEEHLEQSGMTEEDYPENPGLIKTLKLSHNGDLGAYKLGIHNYLGQIVSCPFCLGYWIAIVFITFFYITTNPLISIIDIGWICIISSAIAQIGVMAYKRT